MRAIKFILNFAIDKKLVAGFPPRRLGFEHRSDDVGFVVAIGGIL
jgi:hypothetical protein